MGALASLQLHLKEAFIMYIYIEMRLWETGSTRTASCDRMLRVFKLKIRGAAPEFIFADILFSADFRHARARLMTSARCLYLSGRR